MTIKALKEKVKKLVKAHTPHDFANDYIADAIGRRFDCDTKTIYETGSVVCPLGLSIPLQWRHSHSYWNTDYKLHCWRISGNLYMAVAYERASVSTTVILMNRAKLPETSGKNFVTAAANGVAKNKQTFDTLDDYVNWLKPAIVGIWTRSGGNVFNKVSV